MTKAKIVKKTVKGSPNSDKIVMKMLGVRNINSVDQIGEGAFASVWATPRSKEVVKVASEDHAYMRYATRVAESRRNPFLPRISEIRIFKSKPIDFFAEDDYTELELYVKLERLYSIDDVSEKVVKRELAKLGAKSARHLETPELLLKKRGLSKTAREFLNFLKEIIESEQPDIHRGNIMFRKTGNRYQLVVTDPVI